MTTPPKKPAKSATEPTRETSTLGRRLTSFLGGVVVPCGVPGLTELYFTPDFECPLVPHLRRDAVESFLYDAP